MLDCACVPGERKMHPAASSQPESQGPAPALEATMTPLEMHELFKRMVRDEVAAGTLTFSRRKRLIRYATQVGLSELHANVLIYEARREADAEPIGPGPSWLDRVAGLGSIRWIRWIQIALAIALAFATHVALRRMLQ